MSEPTHSRFSPSGASRWAVCTASVGFIEENASLLPKENTKYADEGTEAHSQAARILTGESRLVVPATPNADMTIYVREYVEFIRDKVQPGDTLLVEHRVPLFYLPAQKGTTDAASVGLHRKSIFIGDLKYGAGVSVYAKHNKQLAIYAESLIQALELFDEVPDDTLVTLAIYQPRDRNDPNPVRLWALSRRELREFTAPLGAIKDKILRGEVEFVPNPEAQCRFCPAKALCKAYAAYGLEAVTDSPIDVVLAEPQIVLPDPAKITREQRQRVLAAKSALIAWLEAAEDQEVYELQQGATPMQYKLVAGKSNRVWADEEAVEKLLRNHLTSEQVRPPGKLVSPKQAEDMLKLKGVELSTRFQNRFAGLITKPPGKPTLVPVTDGRPALEFNPTADLELIPPPTDVI